MGGLIDFRYENKLGLIELAREHPVALARALNRVAASVRTEISKAVREEYNIKKQDIDPNIKMVSANPQRLAASLVIRSRRLPLAMFGARSTRKGVSLQVKRSSRRVTIPGTFMLGGRYGQRVMKRVGAQRLPVGERYTISVTEMIGSRAISERAQAKADERLPIEIDQQMIAIAKGYSRGTWKPK